MSDDCKIAEKLDLAHKWAHRCMDSLTLLQLAEAHGLANELIKYIDDSNKSNGIKLIALIEAVSVGADEMEYLDALKENKNGNGTVN
jgi:hypothetical protein